MGREPLSRERRRLLQDTQNTSPGGARTGRRQRATVLGRGQGVAQAGRPAAPIGPAAPISRAASSPSTAAASGHPASHPPAPEDSPSMQIARLFGELRRAARLEPALLESHLQTSAHVLRALEHGAIDHFPPWPELERLTRAYAALIGLDAHPIVRKLSNLLYAPPPPRSYAKPVPDFVPPSRMGHSETEHDVRTWEEQPGPPGEAYAPPPSAASDPAVLEVPLSQPAAMDDPRQAQSRPSSPAGAHPAAAATHAPPHPHALHSGAEAVQAAGYEPLLAADNTVSTRQDGRPARPAPRGGSALKLAFVSMMLLVILSAMGWLGWQHGREILILSAGDETLAQALTRHFQALRELLR